MTAQVIPFPRPKRVRSAKPLTLVDIHYIAMAMREAAKADPLRRTDLMRARRLLRYAGEVGEFLPIGDDE